jgi:amino-acid N-acetyltransferase
VSRELRQAAADELGVVCGLLQNAGLPTRGVAEHFGDFVVAVEEGRVRGAVGLECYGSAGLLRSLVVEKESRGQGLGEELTRQALVRARARGVETVYLLTTTAERFFPRFGFEALPRAEVDAKVLASTEFKETCCQTAVSMRLRLPKEAARPAD